MPGQLDIKNNSGSIKVLISVTSIDGKTSHTKNKPLDTNETVSIVIKGGTKKLTVLNNSGSIIWDGVVPSYGTSAVQIFPETTTVKYKDITLVDTSKFSVKSNSIISSRMQIGIAILLAVLILICVGYYIRKK